MKKVTVILSAAATYLALTPMAFADTTVSICPIGQFAPLCAFTTGNVPGMISAAITIMFGIGVLIALVFLIYGGIKWITSGGDKQAVAAAREHIIAAVVGLVIMFLAWFILNFIMGLFNIGTITSIVFPHF
jgi:hypothetical protein